MEGLPIIVISLAGAMGLSLEQVDRFEVDATLFHGYTDKDKAQLELVLFVLAAIFLILLSLGLLLIPVVILVLCWEPCTKPPKETLIFDQTTRTIQVHSYQAEWSYDQVSLATVETGISGTCHVALFNSSVESISSSSCLPSSQKVEDSHPKYLFVGGKCAGAEYRRMEELSSLTGIPITQLGSSVRIV